MEEERWKMNRIVVIDRIAREGNDLRTVYMPIALGDEELILPTEVL